MSFELTNGQSTILREISMPEMKRKDIAQTYRLIMESSECDTVDYAVINNAIIDRWSYAGLTWIKKQAHSGKCFA